MPLMNSASFNKVSRLSKQLGRYFFILLAMLYSAPALAVDFDTLSDPYMTTNIHFLLENDPYPHFVRHDDGPMTAFEWDQKPEYILHYTLSGITDFDRHDYDLNSTWTYLGDGDQYFGQNSGWCIGCNGGDTTSWGTIPDWANNRAAGFWTVDLTWNMDGGSPEFTDQLAFQISSPTVTPEPASMALFGLGGIALAAKRFRRKKINSQI